MKKFKELKEGLGHQVPVYHADRKTHVGDVWSGTTSIGAAKLAKKKHAQFTKVDGKHAWVAYDHDHDLYPKGTFRPLEESKYGDAMSSRLPAQLDDPRTEPKKKSTGITKWRTLTDPMTTKTIKEDSVYEEYRDKALEEKKEYHILKGHPYHHKSDAELHYIIKDAGEAEKAIGSHDIKASWKYADQQNDAASILGYRKRGGKQIPEPKRVYTEANVSRVYDHTRGGKALQVRKGNDGSYHGSTGKFDFHAKDHSELQSKLKSWGYRTTPTGVDLKEEMTEREKASHADRIGSTLDSNHNTVHDTVKKAETPKWAPSWGQKDYDKASKSFAKRRKLEEEAPHPGHEMRFSDRMEHQYHGGKEARAARDAYAKHLKSQGHKVKLTSNPGQLLHGTWGNVYSVSHKNPEYWSRPVQESVGTVGDVAFNESGSSHPFHKYTDDQLVDAIKKHSDSAHGLRLHDRKARDKWQQHIQHVHIAREILKSRKRDLSNLEESYQVGDRVIAKIGPHKGEVHKVIHVHDTGHINITPEKSGYGRRNAYHLGAARAHPDQVSPAPLNEFSNTPKTKGSLELYHDAKVKQEKRPEGMTNFGKPIKLKDYFDPFKKPKVGLESKKYRNLAENPIVREAFEAAVAKKNGDELKPEQLDPQGAEPPQPEKQSNVPKPEKKTDKLTVKGPGPDDQFQKEPEVTGLTTLVKQ